MREILLSPGAIAATLRDAIWHVADKGLTTGHRRALDMLFPPGTLARSDLEGLLCVRALARVCLVLRLGGGRGARVMMTASPERPVQ